MEHIQVSSDNADIYYQIYHGIKAWYLMLEPLIWKIIQTLKLNSSLICFLWASNLPSRPQHLFTSITTQTSVGRTYIYHLAVTMKKKKKNTTWPVLWQSIYSRKLRMKMTLYLISNSLFLTSTPDDCMNDLLYCHVGISLPHAPIQGSYA